LLNEGDNLFYFLEVNILTILKTIISILHI
jgi:hypothetical protein